MTYLTYNDVNILPKYSEVKSRSNVDTSTNFLGIDLDLPILAAPMESVVDKNSARVMWDQGILPTFPRFKKADKNGLSTYRLKTQGFNCIPSTGVKQQNISDVYYLSADVILIDVAHGHHNLVKNKIKWFKNNYPSVKIIAGNIATRQAAIDLIKWGADALRVGIGGGSVCTTRMKTGVGVPMISCIKKIHNAVNRPQNNDWKLFDDTWSRDDIDNLVFERHIPIIADGGMKTPGDITKALAAGADVVMLGSMLAGHKESPGTLIEDNEGNTYKEFWGSASEKQKGMTKNVEGVNTKIPYKGSICDTIQHIKESLQSAFSYVGATNIDEFKRNAELIEVTQNGFIEATPHINN